MDQVREAFKNVKEDISSLTLEIESLKVNLSELNWKLSTLSEQVFELKNSFNSFVSNIKRPVFLPTNQQTVPTQTRTFPTDKPLFKPLNSQILGISTGNEGVPTDRQTNQQTDRHIEKAIFSKEEPLKKDPIQNAAELLDSLDGLKKEIRLKFKRLTDQELLVFSTLYQLDEEEGHTDYKGLAIKLNLTESSIRDYVGKLISKGIPLEKKKVNNKNIQLKVPENLKKVASLQTILKLITL